MPPPNGVRVDHHHQIVRTVDQQKESTRKRSQEEIFLNRQEKMRDARDQVRRRLFENEEENGQRADNSDVRDLMERQLEMQNKRWNFDFRNEVPLEGPWVWERIGGPPRQAPPVGAALPSVGTVTPTTGTSAEEEGDEEVEIEGGEMEEAKEDEAQR
ncbi:hypothetical protein J437_LFUL010251 [Ladona fulva]|uniref:Cyclin-dependent kinase inhibitor domain-containing protein n=1 Tax=Ladona fulva TaxID=123851 RepID=A0A8K0KAZ2_LADFU|nr:hypothetical protein J437_LFUL010251 [Ladona fulva]